MKNLLVKLIAFSLVFPVAGFGGRIQNVDVKSLAEVGGTASSLINTSKIYDVTNAQQLSTSISTGALGGSGGVVGTYANILSGKNVDAEKGSTASWTNTGGTFTVISTGQADGVYSFQLVSVAASQSASSTSVAIPAVYYGKNGLVRFTYKTTNSDFVLQATDGTNVLATQTLPASSTYSYGSATFTIPSSGNIQVKIVSASAGTIAFDDVYVGENFQVGQVSQASLVGTITASGCASRWNTTSGAFTDFPVQTGCTYSVTGSALAPLTNLPAIRFASLPPGEYMLQMETVWGSDNANSVSNAQFWDGTNTAREISSGYNPYQNGFTQSIAYTSAQSNVTLSIRGRATGASGISIYGNTTTGTASTSTPMVIKVYRFPTASQLAVTPDSVSGSWSGYHASLCTWNTASATFVDPAANVNASCVLTEKNNRNFGTVTSTGTTGNLLPGIVFTPKNTGRFLACVNIAANAFTSAYFNSQLVDQNGVYVAGGHQYSANSDSTLSYCGILDVPSLSTSTTLKMQMAASSGTARVESGVAPFNPAIEWTLVNLDASRPMPVLTGNVTSSSTGSERLERVAFGGATEATTNCTTSPCTIYRSTPGITSVTRNTTGDYSINFATGTFTAPPTCIAMDTYSVNRGFSANQNAPTTSAFRVQGFATSTGSATDVAGNVLCLGVR